MLSSLSFLRAYRNQYLKPLAASERATALGQRGSRPIRRFTNAKPLRAVKQLDVLTFQEVLKDESKRSSYQLIDVREQYELDTASFREQDSIIHLPLSTVDKWANKIKEGELLEATKPTIVICKAGVRSMNMALFLGR